MSHIRYGILLSLLGALLGGCNEDPLEPPPAPIIVSFEASATTVDEGDEVTLSWETQNATSLSLLGNDGSLEISPFQIDSGSITLILVDTTTFELIAEGDTEHSVSAFLTVTVNPLLPEILSFSATPNAIDEGQEVVLEWETQHAQTLSITTIDGTLVGNFHAAFGSTSVHPTEATTYTLRATRRTHSVTETASVAIKGPPSATLTTSATEIDWGNSVDLVWETEDAETIRIFRGQDLLLETTEASGSLPDLPPLSSTYRLIAARAGKATEVEAAVQVVPVVVAFASATSLPTPVGATVDLAWEIGGATEITLKNGDGSETSFPVPSPASGTTTMELGASGVFELEARSGDLVTRAQTSADILLPPVVGSFEAQRPILSAAPGEATNVVLVWEGIERAEGLELSSDTTGPVDLGGAGLLSGQVEVEISADTVFTLRAWNAAGEDTAQASVRLVPFPTIQRFVALPPYTGAMEEFELVWETTGEAIALTEDGVPVPGVDEEMLSGQITLQTPASTSYELVVTNEAGDRVSQTVEVTVGPLQNLSLQIAPDYVAVGDPVTVSWSNLGGRLIEIRDDTDAVLCTVTDLDSIADGDCSFPVSGEGEQVFVFHLENSIGDEITETLEVLASAGPMITEFTGSPSVIEEGESIAFSWKVTNDPHGNLPTLSLSNGSETFELGDADPNEDTRSFVVETVGELSFTLTAATPLGTKTATWDATVHGIPTVSLDASAPVYDLVTPVVLSWSTQHATDSLVLYVLDSSGNPIEPPLYEVPPAERGNGSFAVQPVEPTTYRLVAKNALGTVGSDEVQVGIVPPAIASFTVDEEVVNYEKREEERTVTVSWAGVERAARLELFADTIGPIDISGLDLEADSVAVPIDATTVFTLTAENAGGTATQTLTVLAIPYPVIDFFVGHPRQVEPMEPFTLEWETSHAAEIELLANDVPVPGISPTQFTGSVVLQAQEDTYYSIRAKNLLGDDSGEGFFIEVGPAEIYAFIAFTPYLPDHVAVGESFTLAWKSIRGRALRLYQDGVEILSTTDQDVIDYGSFDHILTEAGVFDFLLEVDNHQGTTLQETLSIRASEGPVILDFHTDTDEIVVTDTLTFHWEVLSDPHGEPPFLTLSDGTNDYDLTGEDPNLGSKAFPISISPGEHEFTLTATTSMGSTSASVTVNVIPAGPHFVDVAATPEVAQVGDTIELSWATREINEVVLPHVYVVESHEPFIDISTTGTELTLTNLCGNLEDERCADIFFPPGFRPYFGGIPMEALRVMENGHAGFDLSFTQNTFGGVELPSSLAKAANAHLVPFWADLRLGDGAVFYQFDTDARGERLIVQWHDVRFYALANSRPTSLNFQILLWEDGTFEYRYGTMTASIQEWADGLNASIGYQNPNSTEHRNLHFGNDFLTVPGGLSNRGFAFLRDALPPNGTLELYAHYGLGEIPLVGVGSALFTLEKVYVTVQRPIHLLVEGPSVPAIQGEPFSISWKTKFADGVMVEKVGGEVICPERSALSGQGECTIVEATTGSYTYKVKAMSQEGSIAEALVEVEVLPRFELLSFEASEEEVGYGESVTLSWSAVGAANASLTANGVEIFPAGADPNTGTLVVPLTEKTTFVFTAAPSDSRPPLSETREVSVRQFEITVSADQTSVAPGTPVTLSWTIDSPSGESPRLFMPSAPLEEVDLATETSASFVDIRTSGTALPMHTVDDPAYLEQVSLDFSDDGFAFPFMDARHARFVVTRAGYLTVGDPASSEVKSPNLPLPTGDALAENVHLAPYWGSLLTDHEVEVYYQAFTGAGGEVQAIVQWRISHPAGREWNFQVVLFEDGQFEYRYGLMAPQAEPASNGAGRTIGHAMSATQGSTLHFGGRDGMPGAPFPNLSHRTFRWRPLAGSTAMVTPEFDSTYEICGELRGYVACDSVEVEVVGVAAPSLTLSAAPTALAAGETIEISWTSSRAESVNLGSLAWMVPQETSEPFIDISTTGTELVLTDLCGTEPDERCADITFPAGFRFPFAGSVEDSIRVMENGYAGFNFTFAGNFFNPRIPSGGGGNLHLSPFGADLDLTTQGSVHYSFDSDARGQRLIIQWTDAKSHHWNSSLNFQMILWEDGAFDFRFGEMSAPDSPAFAAGSGAAVGYQAPDLSHFHTLNRDRTPVSGGLAHRSWAYRPLPLPPHGSLSVPARPDTNRIDGVAIGPGGKDLVSIPITIHPPPTLNLWRLGVGPVELGDPVVLEWRTELATSVVVEGPAGNVICTAAPHQIERGSCEVTPTTTGRHFYRVTATGLGGSIEQALPIDVVPRLEVLGFSVDKSKILPGEQVEFSWASLGAAEAFITLNDDPPIGPLPASGSHTLPLTASANALLTVVSSDGREKHAGLHVSVKSFDLSLTASATLVAPGTPVTIHIQVDELAGGGTPTFYVNEFVEVDLDAEPSSAYADISETGMSLSATTGYVTIDLISSGFAFPFGGEPQTHVSLGKNVFLNFDLSANQLVNVPSALPSASAYSEGVDIAPYWGFLIVGASYRHQFGTDASGRDFMLLQIVERGNTSIDRDWHIQVALFEDGQFEFRYGDMGPPGPEAEGEHRSIGYQLAPDVGASFHYGPGFGDTVPGGLANRTIRLREVFGPSFTVTPTETKKYAVCGYLNGYQACEVVEIQTL